MWSDTASLMRSMEGIEDYVLNQDKIVTYRWLSNKLKVHTNTAKQLLYTFSIKHTDDHLLITYLVSGLTQDGGVKVLVVNQSEVDRVKSSLDTVTSEHVYSIQKASSALSSSDLYLADSTAESSDKKLSSIASRQVEEREFKVFIPDNPPAITRNGQTSSKPQKEPARPSLFNTKPNASQKKDLEEDEHKKENEQVPDLKSSVKNKVASPSKIKSPTKNSKKKSVPSKGGSIGAFFNKQNTLNAEKKKNEVPVQVEKETEKSLLKTTENTSNSKMEDYDDQYSASDTGTEQEKCVSKTPARKGKANKSNKNNKRKSDHITPAKKRKRIVLASDSESDGEDDEDKMDMEEEPEPELVPQVEIPDSDDEVIPPTPFGQRSRKRIRKQVDRTFNDEDGFVITKKEFIYESCSDEEDCSPSKGESSTSPVKEKDEESVTNIVPEKVDNKNTENLNEDDQVKKIDQKPKGNKGKPEKKRAKGKNKTPEISPKTGNRQVSITSFFKKK